MAAIGETKDLAIPEVRICPFSFLLVNCRPVQEEMKKSRKLLRRRGSTIGDGRGKGGGKGEKSQAGGDWGLRVGTGEEQTISYVFLAAVAVLTEGGCEARDMLLQPRGQKGNFAIAVSDAHAFRWFGRGRDFEPNQGNHYQIEKVGRST